MPTYRTLCNRCERYALIGMPYRRWYRVARRVVRLLAAHGYEGYPEVIDHRRRWLCDVVAITSPRVSVKRNLILAWGESRGLHNLPGMTKSTRAALKHYHITGEIRGPKTSRFAKVLRGDDSIVVVDTWMARALGVPDRQGRNKSTQELAEHVVKNVKSRLWCDRSKWVLCTMAETQAAIWAGMIRTHYKDGKIPLMRVEDVGLYRNGPNRTLTETPF